MKLSVVIPVYNEEKTLKDIISKVENFTDKNVEKEIILINDASKDDSLSVIKTFDKKKGFIAPKDAYGLLRRCRASVALACCGSKVSVFS